MDPNFPKKYKKEGLKNGFYETYTRKEILGTSIKIFV